MKIISTFVFLGLAGLAVINYLAYQKSQPLPVYQWIGYGKKLFNELIEGKKSDAGEKLVDVSKWTDAKGVVHYENRPVEGAKTLAIDPDSNILPSAPIVVLPSGVQSQAKPTSADEQLRSLQEAKRAHFEALTQ